MYLGPPLPRQQPGRYGDLPGDLQNGVSPQTQGTLDFMKYKIIIRVRYTSHQGAQGYGAGTYPDIFKKRNSPTALGSAWGCTLDTSKYKIKSPGKSQLSSGSGEGGTRDTVDSHIIFILFPANSYSVPSHLQGNRPKADSSLFDDLDDEGGADDLFAKPKETGKKKPPGGVALFGDADVFGSPPKKEPEKPPENKVCVAR